MDHKFSSDPRAEFAMPQGGIMGRAPHKDEKLKVAVFGLSTGRELSKPSAPAPALLCFIPGHLRKGRGYDIARASQGTSDRR